MIFTVTALSGAAIVDGQPSEDAPDVELTANGLWHEQVHPFFCNPSQAAQARNLE